MTHHSARLAGAIAVAIVAGACGGNSNGNAAAGDSALATTSAPAAAATQPALSDTAVASTAAPQPRPEHARTERDRRPPPSQPPTRSEPMRPVGEVAEGTEIVLHANRRVCTDSNRVGEEVTASVADPVRGANGVSIPAGAIVRLRITALKRSENAKDPIDMGFEPVSVEFDGQTYALSARVIDERIDRVRNEPKSKDVQKVVGGALLGAIAGKLIGKSTKGAVIGAATGAAAGAGVAAETANYEGCIAAGSNLTVRLTAPVTIR